MLRTILAALDGTSNSQAVLELGVAWARRFDAMLVGMAVIDEPGLHYPEEQLLGEAPHFRRINEELLRQATSRGDQILEAAAIRCSEGEVAFKALEPVGEPAEQIARESQRYDLILIARDTRFRLEAERQADDTLTRILHRSPRPVVVVPPEVGPGEEVLVAYDGSLQASRALRAFEASGLAAGRKVRVACVGQSFEELGRLAGRAIEFLQSHGIQASKELCVLPSGRTPAELLLGHARRASAGLIVMGVYGQPTWREWFVGSTTRAMLRQSTVPLFVWH